jgi:hypothetical protein
MAVKLLTDKREFLGLAGDTKPTLTTGGVGAKFYETDTGKIFIWDGAAWVVLEKVAIT